MENETQMAHDGSKCHPRMLTKSTSCRRVDFENCKQHSMENFLRAPIGILAGKSLGCCCRYCLPFLSCFPCQEIRAFFRAVSTTSKRLYNILGQQ